MMNCAKIYHSSLHLKQHNTFYNYGKILSFNDRRAHYCKMRNTTISRHILYGGHLEDGLENITASEQDLSAQPTSKNMSFF